MEIEECLRDRDKNVEFDANFKIKFDEKVWCHENAGIIRF